MNESNLKTKVLRILEIRQV